MTIGPRVRRSTLTARTEDALRQDIIDGTLEPGTRLTASDLGERYEVSATPLREALQRLAVQELVTMDPWLGTTVAPISRAHLRDTYLIRGLLESLAVERSVTRADDEWELRVRDAFHRFERAVVEVDGEHSELAWADAHRAFHEAVASRCDSPWLQKMLTVINVHSERYRMLSVKTGVRDPIAEHGAIFAAAMARDPAATVAATTAHLSRTVEVIEKSLLA